MTGRLDLFPSGSTKVANILEAFIMIVLYHFLHTVPFFNHFDDLGLCGSPLTLVTSALRGRGHLDHIGLKSPKWAEVTEMWTEVTWVEISVGLDRQYPNELSSSSNQNSNQY